MLQAHIKKKQKKKKCKNRHLKRKVPQPLVATLGFKFLVHLGLILCSVLGKLNFLCHELGKGSCLMLW